MTTTIPCRHLATLGDGTVGLPGCGDPGCPPPLRSAGWAFSAADDVFDAVLTELALGHTLGGSLLRVAERHRPSGPWFLADHDQVAVVAPYDGLRLAALGRGEYVVADGPDAGMSTQLGGTGAAHAWDPVPVGAAGSLLLLDPCGVTTTYLAPEATR